MALEIRAKQQDEGFTDTSEIFFQEYMLNFRIPLDQLPRAGCLHSNNSLTAASTTGVGIQVLIMGVC